MAGRVAFTVGHSTHPLDALVALLREHGVEAIADVRRWPRSRRHPQFDDDALAVELPPRGIAYHHLGGLGGRRRPLPDTANDGWEVEAFRGYADHMASAEFDEALAALERIAGAAATAVMCAEALWWRCHRRLVADALVARGWTVRHIGSDGGATEHRLTEFAVVDGRRVRYPSVQLRLG